MLPQQQQDGHVAGQEQQTPQGQVMCHGEQQLGVRRVDRRDLGMIHARIVRKDGVGVHSGRERAAVEEIAPDVA